MDVHSNAVVSGNLVEDFLPCENMEVGDGVSLEWLSIFVEDCFNGGFTSQPLPTPTPTTAHQTPNSQAQQQEQRPPAPSLTQKDISVSVSVPSKARTKRRKINHHHNNSFHTFHVTVNSLDPPPLLPQAYWLADSELLIPRKESENEEGSPPPLRQEELVAEEDDKVVRNEEGQGPRRCTHCLSYKTPQWRAGPLGPKTLCNACGVRFKSGRLLPEYRPAKSPTFESFKHSNSHKKVMEMRMMATILSPHTN